MLVHACPEGNVAYLELHFSPSVELISLVRRFVFDFYRQILKDEDAVSRVALTTHELLENAVRYSTNGVAMVRIDVTGDDESPRRRLRIQMENDAEESHRIALGEIFEEIQRAEDPFEHYQKVMLRNAKRTDGSGLGLARILAEAEMDLDYEIVDDRVRILASTGVTVTAREDTNEAGNEVSRGQA
jgi:hypothetical protein